MFAFLTAFTVCPFCGQAACVGGPASAGILGGISAGFVSLLRRSFRRRRYHQPHACAHHDEPQQ
jgi:hypothetical protein